MGLFLPIGERLAEERKRLGYNQTDFAALVGITRKTLFGYESGERAPDAVALATWASNGLDVMYVVTGNRAPNVTDQSYRALKPDMTESSNPVTHSVAAGPLGEYQLNRREKALLENYRGSDEEGRRAMESTASALAHRDSAKKKGRQGGE